MISLPTCLCQNIFVAYHHARTLEIHHASTTGLCGQPEQIDCRTDLANTELEAIIKKLQAIPQKQESSTTPLRSGTTPFIGNV